ncbi:MAG: hypothetical protein J6Q38_05725 [Clostridia bacterium]|nr:hypothetical protein [Clostridia bacterium]
MGKNKKRKGTFILFLTLFFTIFITLYSFSNKMLIKIGETTYSAILSSASYYALEEALDPSFDFGSYFIVEKNKDGDISMIQTNAYKFNLLANKIVNGVSEYLENEISSGVDVPIGVFTGISLFSGFGKKVKMPLIAIYSVKCNIISSFTDAGINQTKHSLQIEIEPNVFVVTRFSNKNLIDKINVLIYENVIVGKTPNTYLEGFVISAEKTL